MKLEDLVEIEPFSKHLAEGGSSVIRIWSETALEICRDQHRDIARIRQIYSEIPSTELRPQQLISFVEAILEAMPSDEDRKTLIRVEALQFRTFERRAQ